MRWIIHLTNGKAVVENHAHGRTWRKVYKDNYGNIEAMCLQKIPGGTKYYIKESPTKEYWTYEDFEQAFGGASKHLARSICSKREVKLVDDEFIAYWDVLTIDANGNVSKSVKTSDEIGYSTL